MTLPLPRLDDKSYADLVAEARALIPSYYPQWIDHNPADPGITVLELFAWLAEMLIYRVDRLPDAHLRTFLKLLNPADWQPGPDLEEDLRSTVATLRQRYRAVTVADYEALAKAASPGVARARCVPRRNLSATTEAGRSAPAAGRVSVILVSDPEQAGSTDEASQPGAPLPSAALLTTVRADLEPRRLLTTRLRVVAPVYAPVGAEILVAVEPDVPEELVKGRILETLGALLDPLTGGPDGEGWPFGRDVYSSEIYELVDGVAGVDHVPDVALSSVCPSGAPSCHEAELLWHDDGEPIGLSLAAHQLPWARLAADQLICATAFTPIRVYLQATRDSGYEAALARQRAHEVVRQLFHPLHGGPDLESVWEISFDSIETAVADLDEIATVDDLTVDAAGGRLVEQSPGVWSVRLEAAELAELSIVVEVDA